MAIVTAKAQRETELVSEIAALRIENALLNETLSLYRQRDVQLYPEVIQREHTKIKGREELHAAVEQASTWFEALKSALDNRVEEHVRRMLQDGTGSDEATQEHIARVRKAQENVQQLRNAVDEMRRIAEESLCPLQAPATTSQ